MLTAATEMMIKLKIGEIKKNASRKVDNYCFGLEFFTPYSSKTFIIIIIQLKNIHYHNNPPGED